MTQEYEVVKTLYTGCFSRVYEAIPASNEFPLRYAAKRTFLHTPEALHSALTERAILEIITNKQDGFHPNFLPTMYRSFLDGNSAVCVMTIGCGLNLTELCTLMGRRLYEEEMKFYSIELLCGLEHLHSLKIVHLDIQPENILLKHTGHIMITDFSSAYLDNGEKDTVSQALHFKGSLEFMAPEIANKTLISPKADIWCLAFTMAWLTVGSLRPAARSQKELLELAKAGAWKLPKQAKITRLLHALLRMSLQIEPSKRPTIEELKHFPFFANVDWRKGPLFKLKPPINPLEQLDRAPLESTPTIDQRSGPLVLKPNSTEMESKKFFTKPGNIQVKITDQQRLQLNNFEFTHPLLIPRITPEKSPQFIRRGCSLM